VSRWTLADAHAQSGRSAVVTGANSGIGFRAAVGLAQRGARVVMACRDVAKARAALDRLRAAAPDAEAEVRELDLADLSSVRAFAQGVEEVDLLVNNAGVMALPHRRTADGFEMQLGTNHLGHFALTGLLMPTLLAGTDPRVVTVSSVAHKMGSIAFDDLQSERRYSKWAAYGQSKLANLLFCFELQRRADAAAARLRSLAAHPGYAATDLQQAGPRMAGRKLEEMAMGLLNRVVAQSDERGALPTLYAATMDLPGGAYVGPDGPGEWRGSPRLVGASKAATDLGTAARLWEVSEELTGVRYDFAGAATTAR
jgi:NAD(P)-dependent dehydrogenase (short-subunit alcohol dehydrogenase family)